MGRFLQRKDKQICGLELLGALLGKQFFISPRTRRVITTHCAFIGISTFLKDCAGKTARLWTDNDGGLGALVRGVCVCGRPQRDSACRVADGSGQPHRPVRRARVIT